MSRPSVRAIRSSLFIVSRMSALGTSGPSGTTFRSRTAPELSRPSDDLVEVGQPAGHAAVEACGRRVGGDVPEDALAGRSSTRPSSPRGRASQTGIVEAGPRDAIAPAALTRARPRRPVTSHHDRAEPDADPCRVRRGLCRARAPRPGPARRRRRRGRRPARTASRTWTSGRSPSTWLSSRPSTPASSASSARSTSSDGPAQPTRRRARAAGPGPLPRARRRPSSPRAGSPWPARPPPSRPPASRPAPRSSCAPIPTSPAGSPAERTSCWAPSTPSRCPSRAAARSTPAPPPAASPRCCSAGVPPRSSPSTSATASWPGACAPTTASGCTSAPTCRTLTPEAIDGPVDLVVADLSFISLRLVLPALTACARADADLLPMVKPQFEVGRERLGAGGVVRDPEHRVQAVLRGRPGRGVARLGDCRGGGESAARAGWQRGVLPVAAPRRRSAAGGTGPSSSGGGAAVSQTAHEPASSGSAPRRVLLTVHTGRRGHRRAGPHVRGAADRRRHHRPAARGRGRRRSASPTPRWWPPTPRPPATPRS